MHQNVPKITLYTWVHPEFNVMLELRIGWVHALISTNSFLLRLQFRCSFWVEMNHYPHENVPSLEPRTSIVYLLLVWVYRWQRKYAFDFRHLSVGLVQSLNLTSLPHVLYRKFGNSDWRSTYSLFFTAFKAFSEKGGRAALDFDKELKH